MRDVGLDDAAGAASRAARGTRAAPTSRSPVAIGVVTARWISGDVVHRSPASTAPRTSRGRTARAPWRRACPSAGEGRAWQSTMMSIVVADRVAHRARRRPRRSGSAASPSSGIVSRHGHRLEGGEALLDGLRGQVAEALGVGGIGLVEVLHLPAAQVAVECGRSRAPARPRACGRARRGSCRGCPTARCRCR